PGRDLCPVLGETVIVAGDGARADVHLRADGGVADIAQVIDLRRLPDLGVLRLDEIADPTSGRQPRARPQPREGADLHARAELGALEMAERPDLGPVGDR